MIGGVPAVPAADAGAAVFLALPGPLKERLLAESVGSVFRI